MIGCKSWATTPGRRGRSDMFSALSAETYLRYFTQQFWNSEVQRHGIAALKFPPQSRLPSMYSWHQLDWTHVKARHGKAACDWMEKAWNRLSKTSDNQMLWRWLYHRTIHIVEPRSARVTWYMARTMWAEMDLSAWETYKRVENAGRDMVDEIVETCPNEEEEDPLTCDQEPPADLIGFFFQTVRDALNELNREASFIQSFVADYVRLESVNAKHRIFVTYADTMRQRMGLYQESIISPIIKLLTFATGEQMTPHTWTWITRDPDVRKLVTEDYSDLASKLTTCWHFFNVIADHFSEDAQVRFDAMKHQFSAIPPSSALPMANRIEKMALNQYNKLDSSDPRRRIADQWGEILKQGEALLNPPPGTPAAALNNSLANVCQAVDQVEADEEQAMNQEFPDNPAPQQVAGSGLQNDQPPPGKYYQPREIAWEIWSSRADPDENR